MENEEFQQLKQALLDMVDSNRMTVRQVSNLAEQLYATKARCTHLERRLVAAEGEIKRLNSALVSGEDNG